MSAELVHDLLDEAAAERPDHAAVVDADTSLTYGELRAKSVGLARFLVDAGVGPGNRVVVAADNSCAVVAVVYAIARIGAVFVLVHPDIRPAQLRYVADDCTPTLVLHAPHFHHSVVGAGLADRARELELPAVAPHDVVTDTAWNPAQTDVAALIYTSGSTSAPKAVVSTHAQIRWATAAIAARLQIAPADVIGSFLPLSFDYGLYQVFLAATARCTLRLGRMHSVGPGLVPRLAHDRVTVLPVVPSLAGALIALLERRAATLPDLRLVTNTGAHFPAAYVRRLGELLPDTGLALMFGLTECKRTSILRPDEVAAHPDSVGRPLDGSRCWIVDSDGRSVPPGTRGELVVAGPHVMAGYWQAPQLTADRFRPGPEGERALYTGDLCSIDAGGFLYFYGRDDDVYKSNGFRVGALEVEAAALDVPGVHAVALIPQLPAGPTLFACADLLPAEIVSGLRERLEDFKIPSRIELVPQLPLTANGKVDKRALRTLVGCQ